jgi:hypothetical protein
MLNQREPRLPVSRALTTGNRNHHRDYQENEHIESLRELPEKRQIARPISRVDAYNVVGGICPGTPAGVTSAFPAASSAA